MARAGQVLENPVTGERLEFEATADETDGELLRYRLRFVASGLASQEQLHPYQRERHEVLAGRLGLRLAGRTRWLAPGDVVVVPGGTPHLLTSRGPVEVRFEIRPALRTEVFLETLAGLSLEGRVDRRGYPNPLQLAAIGHEFLDEAYSTRVPLRLQRTLLGTATAVAARRGYAGWYERFSDPALARRRVDGSLPRADTASYVFVDEWDVDAPADEVFDVLADAATYPEWWVPVHLDAAVDGPPAVGTTAHQRFRGRLPYRLRTTSTIVALERPHLLEAAVEGDLKGRGSWQLYPRNGGTRVTFDWRVDPRRGFLRALTPLLRPLFRWNHDWAVDKAREGLGPYVRWRRVEGAAPGVAVGAG